MKGVFTMIIYTDSNSEFIGTNLTPAHTHAATTDFANILDDLSKGNIPCGTGQPFPVNWENDSKTDPNQPPWIDGSQPINWSTNPNPWSNL